MSTTEDSGSESDALTTESDVREAGFFDGLSAWFSCTVAKHRIQAWEENDGSLADVDTAMYLFSEDAEEEDTKRLYSTDAYLSEHLAIFHPIFIDECVKAKSLKKTALGMFFLPPAELHKIIGDKVKFHWESLVESEERERRDSGHQSSKKQTFNSGSRGPSRTTSSVGSQIKVTTHNARHQEPCASDQPHPHRSHQRENVTDQGQNNQLTERGVEREGISGPGTSSTKRHSANVERVRKNDLRSPSKKQKTDSPSKHATQGYGSFSKGNTQKSACSADHPDNRRQHKQNLYQEYTWVNDLPQVHGELWEFTVGQNGCRVDLKG